MNLADMLCYADIHELGRIARTYSCDCSGNSKNELIQSILTTVSRKDVFEQQVINLEIEDIRFLNSLLFDRRDTFSLEELMARANQTNLQKGEDWNPRELITRFKQRGWLFNGYSQQTKYLFRVPDDLKRRFGETLTAHFGKKLQRLDLPPSVYRDEQHLLANDVQLFLKALSQQELPLNAEGFLYKRQLQQILDQLSIQEEQVGKTAWRFGYGRRYREYPSRFSFIYDYCYYQGLIEENGLTLAITQLGRDKLQSGKKEDIADLYAFWLRLYKSPIPNLLSLVHWVDRLTRQWVVSGSLADVLGRLIKPYFYDTPESIYEQRLIPMMMHLGLIRIGAEERHGTVLQATKLGSSLIAGTYVPEEDRIDLSIDKA